MTLKDSIQKTKDFAKKVFSYTNNYSNIYFRFVSRNPKTSTALWAVGTYLIWRLIPGVSS